MKDKCLCPECNETMILIKCYEVDHEGIGHTWYQYRCPDCDFETDYFDSKEGAINDANTSSRWAISEEEVRRNEMLYTAYYPLY